MKIGKILHISQPAKKTPTMKHRRMRPARNRRNEKTFIPVVLALAFLLTSLPVPLGAHFSTPGCWVVALQGQSFRRDEHAPTDATSYAKRSRRGRAWRSTSPMAELPASRSSNEPGLADAGCEPCRVILRTSRNRICEAPTLPAPGSANPNSLASRSRWARLLGYSGGSGGRVRSTNAPAFPYSGPRKWLG